MLYIPCNGVTALKPPGAEGAAPSKLWEATGLRPGMNSPLVWRERIYSASGAGTLKCAEAASGLLIWQLKRKGPFSASAVAAGDQICLVNEKGLLHVVEARADAREGRLVRTLDLGDGERIFLATPAISGRALYLRNDVHLWKLGGR